MDEDVKDEEEETSTSEEESSEESSTSETEEKSIPYSRFREVNSKMRNLEQEIQSLRTQKSDTGSLTEDQQRELQAKQYLKNLYKEVLSEEQKETQERETREQQEFENSVDNILAVNPEVKKSEFLTFLETKADKFGIISVEGGMNLFKEMKNFSNGSDKSKKPDMPKTEGTGEFKTTYEESDKSKSFSQIAEDAIRQMFGKK